MSGRIWSTVDESARVGWLRWSNPEASNAFSNAMAAELSEALTILESNDRVVSIVLTSEGSDLTSGFDAGEAYEVYRSMPGGAGGRVPSQRSRLRAHDVWWGPTGFFSRVANCSKATILAAHGKSYGPGLYLATFCTVVICADDTRFAHPRWNLVGVDGDVAMLIEAIGLKRAREVAYLGKVITAQEALDWNLVDAVTTRAGLEDAALEIAGNCASLLKDGVVTGAYFRNITNNVLGMAGGFAAAIQLGALASNIHYREGEFNFLRERRDHGVEEALRLADEYFAPSPTESDG